MEERSFKIPLKDLRNYIDAFGVVVKDEKGNFFISLDKDLFRENDILEEGTKVFIIDTEPFYRKSLPYINEVKFSEEYTKQIAKNFKKAIDIRTPDGKREQYQKKIMGSIGKITSKSVLNKENGTTSITAEEIIAMEKNHGIHRDEILGELKIGSESLLRQFKTMMEEDEDDDIKLALETVIGALRLQRNDSNKIGQVCDRIRVLIEEEYPELKKIKEKEE